ncbi:E3 ubiquitin ligase PARAQUAT TOLERANCE 3 isoform X1 [Cryptomeria japonica]|uniref:E3 ubiquitin ligase PARAQUAT TOLERANCE 3 isoform X1 n=2 Tax=Cryptomeria japonica TaxID=3369 RepID=UPI0027DA06DF|nr:E3 ubiquitin ligase PARAQUAT TOLERANCE 3 isoform X1 [Cryptomeria japonica]
MVVHFKFRSAVEFDSVELEGPSISIRDLKQKIAYHKKLNTCKDFDLLITNAETGQEYIDDSILVPQNTSVIIKRVPAARPKSAVVVPDIESLVKVSSIKITEKDDTQQSLSLSIADDNGFGDFGIDLYADSENHEKYMDGSDNIAGLINNADMDTKRQDQGPYSGSQMLVKDNFGKSILSGHCISRCVRNGDSANGIKKSELSVHINSEDRDISYNTSDQLVTPLKSNQMIFAKKADAILPTLPNSELPSELKCSLCQAIFKEAVMIPCCQFSFCHDCIMRVLIENGRCPQCNSSKFKIDELLPNIALRQAIEHFLESQLTMSSGEDFAAKHAPDGESAIQAKAVSQALSNTRGKLQRSESPSATVGPAEKESYQIIPESAGMSEGKKSIVDNGESGKVSKVLLSMSLKEEGITMESQTSKGKKRKKPLHSSATDGTTNFMASGRAKKGGRRCFVCGSLDHLARDCPDNAAPFSQPAMFHGGGPMYPGSIPAYATDAYWHGASVPHMRHFANMYGPTPPSMPFEAPMMPVAPYAIPPYMPSMYAGVPIHCGFMRMESIGPALVTPSERPLSREEFMELQEHERWRRLTQEQQDREQIQEKANSVEGDSREHCLETRRSWYDQQQDSEDDHHLPYNKHDIDRDSVGNYSSESNFQKSRSGRPAQYSQTKYLDSSAFHKLDSVSDRSDYEKSGRRRHAQKLSWEKYIESNAYEGTNSVSDGSDCQKSRSGRLTRKHSQEKYNGCRRQDSMFEDEDDLSLNDRKGKNLHSERWHGCLKSQKYYSKNHRPYVENSMDGSTSELEEYGLEPAKACNNYRESGYLKPAKHSSTKKSERNVMLRESGSPSSSHLYRHGSRKHSFDDLKHATYHKKDAKKYASPEYAEEDERASLYEYHYLKEENLERSLEDGRSKNSHPKKRSHLTSEYDHCFSGDTSKRRKKHKNNQRNSLDRTRDTESHVIDSSDIHHSRYAKHESKSHSHPTGSVLDPIEGSRWQMDTGFDSEKETEDVYHMYHPRDKKEHSHKKKVK